MCRIEPEAIPIAADRIRVGVLSRIILLGFSLGLIKPLFDFFLVTNSRKQKRMNKIITVASIRIKHEEKKAVTNRAARSMLITVTTSLMVARPGATTLSGSIPCLKERNVTITVKDDKKITAIRADTSEIITSSTNPVLGRPRSILAVCAKKPIRDDSKMLRINAEPTLFHKRIFSRSSLPS